MTITWELAAGILGAIVLIGNAGAMIRKWLTPAINLTKTVEEHSKAIAQIKEHETTDLERLNSLEALNKAQVKMMLCMVNHMIDGNGIERMKETRDDIQNLFMDL